MPNETKSLDPMVTQLVAAIRYEARLVSDLIALQLQQRVAITDDNLIAIEDTTFATQRILCTLSESQRLRRALSDHLAVVELGSVCKLERDQLLELTLVLAREVQVNRGLLRQSLVSGVERGDANTSGPLAE
jgi:hypothetical protein